MKIFNLQSAVFVVAMGMAVGFVNCGDGSSSPE